MVFLLANITNTTHQKIRIYIGIARREFYGRDMYRINALKRLTANTLKMNMLVMVLMFSTIIFHTKGVFGIVAALVGYFMDYTFF